jgi:hypothetical protein
MNKVVVMIVVVIVGGGIVLGFWQKNDRQTLEGSEVQSASFKDLSGLDKIGEVDAKNEDQPKIQNDSKSGLSEDEIKNSLEDTSGEVKEDEEEIEEELLEQKKQQEEMMDAMKAFQ